MEVAEEQVHTLINWKQAIHLLAFGGDTTPNHESLANFKGIQKVIIERGRTFGLTALMKDHLLQAFKKDRGIEGIEDLDKLPIIQFVNRIA